MKIMKSFIILSTLMAAALCCSDARAGASPVFADGSVLLAASDYIEVPSQVPGYQQTPSIPGGFVDAIAKCGDGVVNGSENCDEGSGGLWDVISGSKTCGVGFSCAAPGTLDQCQCYRNHECGDGHISIGYEECELTADPIGCTDNGSCIQCQCLEPIPLCGDGVKAAGEECDPKASLTGCGTAQYCSNQCTCKTWTMIDAPVCGNSVVEGSEECDSSTLGCPTIPNAINMTCNSDCLCQYDPIYTAPECHDGKLDPGEECDEPGGPSGAPIPCFPPQTCDNDCHCVTPQPSCGNGKKEAGEACDGSDSSCVPGDGFDLTCDGSCKCVYTKLCGNGTFDPGAGEECEPGIQAPEPGSCQAGAVCGNTCTCVPDTTPKPICGNGILEPNEGCEPSIPGSCDNTQYCDQLDCICLPNLCTPNGTQEAGEACDPLIPVGASGSCPSGKQCTNQCECQPEVQVTCNPNGVLEASEACDPGIAFPNQGSCQAGSNCNQSCECEPTVGCMADGFHQVPDEQCDFFQSGLVWGTQAYADEMVKQCENESGMTLPAGAKWDACEMSECKCTYTLPQCVMGQPGVECDQQPPGTQCPIPNSACSLNCTCVAPPSSGGICGNNVLEAGEQCDPPLTGACAAGETCDANCQCAGGGGAPFCGDGVVIGQEECEPGKVFCFGLDVCDPVDCLCKSQPLASCGDGVVSPGLEQCDPQVFPTGCASGLVCNSSCDCVPGTAFLLCGDGTLNQGEECDFAAADPLATCTAGQSPTACAQDCTCTYETRPTIPTEPSQVETVVEAPTDDCFVYTSSFSSDAAKEALDGLNAAFRQATLRPDDRYGEPEQWVTIYCRFGRAAAPQALLSEGLALNLSGTALPDSSDNLRPYMFVLESGSKPLPIGEFATFETIAEPLMILPLTDSPSAQFAKAAILPELSASPSLAQLTPFLPSSVEVAGGLKVLNGVIEHQAYAVVPGQSYSIQLPEGGSVQLDAVADQGAPAGTASVVHVVRMQLEPGGTPFTAVEGYEERKNSEDLQLDTAADLTMLAARRQGETPLTSSQVSTDAWERNLNYRGLFIQSQYVAKGQTMTAADDGLAIYQGLASQYVAKGQTMTAAEQRSFTALGVMPMNLSQGGGCNCRLGQSNRLEGTFAQFLLGAFILAVAVTGLRRRARRKG